MNGQTVTHKLLIPNDGKPNCFSTNDIKIEQSINLNEQNAYLNFDLAQSTEYVKKLLVSGDFDILYKLIYTIVEIQHFTLYYVFNLLFKESYETIRYIMNKTIPTNQKTLLELLIRNYNIKIINVILINDYCDLFFGLPETPRKDMKVRILLISLIRVLLLQDKVNQLIMTNGIELIQKQPENRTIIRFRISVQIFLNLVQKFNEIYEQISPTTILKTKYAKYERFKLRGVIANTMNCVFYILIRYELKWIYLMKNILSRMCYIIHDKNFNLRFLKEKILCNKTIKTEFKNAGITLPKYAK